MAFRKPGRHFRKAKSAVSLGIEPHELELQSQVRAALERIGCFVTNLSAPYRSHVTPGTPDMYAVHPAWGVRCWLETKTAIGSLSNAQLEWHAAEREAGGTVIVVRSVADAVRTFGALPRRRT